MSSVSTDVEKPLFVARLNNVKPLATLLRAVQFKEKANFHITKKGICFIVEDSLCVQSIAYLDRAIFQHYQLREDTPDFDGEYIIGISLNTLIECINIFASPIGASGSYSGDSGNIFGRGSTALKMVYTEPGSQLELVLEDGGVVTLCKLVTFEPEVELEVDFDSSHIIQKMMMKSEWLRDAFTEMDSTSDKITFLISPDKPFFRLSCSGITGSTEMDYPNDKDVLETFHCDTMTQQSYKFTHIQHCIKALNASERVAIRTNDRGFMHVKFMIPITTDSQERHVFVFFLFSPLETNLESD